MQTHPRYFSAAIETVPEILRHRTCLYVGAHPNGGCALIPELREAGYRITIVEAWKDNVNILKNMLHDSEEILCADIREWKAREDYDLVLWWHGPEHVPIGDREQTLDKISGYAKKYCVVAGPWGCYPQGAADGNEFQRHVSELEPDWFCERGWCVKTVGQRSVPGGQVVAWRKKS